jgi:hypothetical protein
VELEHRSEELKKVEKSPKKVEKSSKKVEKSQNSELSRKLIDLEAAHVDLSNNLTEKNSQFEHVCQDLESEKNRNSEQILQIDSLESDLEKKVLEVGSLSELLNETSKEVESGKKVTPKKFWRFNLSFKTLPVLRARRVVKRKRSNVSTKHRSKLIQ